MGFRGNWREIRGLERDATGVTQSTEPGHRVQGAGFDGGLDRIGGEGDDGFHGDGFSFGLAQGVRPGAVAAGAVFVWGGNERSSESHSGRRSFHGRSSLF